MLKAFSAVSASPFAVATESCGPCCVLHRRSDQPKHRTLHRPRVKRRRLGLEYIQGVSANRRLRFCKKSLDLSPCWLAFGLGDKEPLQHRGARPVWSRLLIKRSSSRAALCHSITQRAASELDALTALHRGCDLIDSSAALAGGKNGHLSTGRSLFRSA